MLDYPGEPNHKGHYKKEAGESESEREDIKKEAKVREERRCYAAGFEDGGRGHKPRNADNSKIWRRQGNGFSPRTSQGNTGLLTP